MFWLQGFSADPQNPFITPAGTQIVGGMVPNPNVKASVTPLFNFDKTRLYQVPSAAGATPYISPRMMVGQLPSGLTVVPVASYFPVGTTPPKSNAAPYLYWDPGITTISGMTTTSSFGSIQNSGGTISLMPNSFNSTGAVQIFTNAGVAEPYWFDANNNITADATENWANYDSFQILSAGLDGKYGGTTVTTGRLYPTGLNYDLTNLADNDNLANFATKARLGDAIP